jgi:hypothetical protein
MAGWAGKDREFGGIWAVEGFAAQWSSDPREGSLAVFKPGVQKIKMT